MMRAPMSPEDVKALRRELACTARDLAAAIGVEQQTIFAWEKGELFPTKRHVELLEALRARGPGAVPRSPKKGASAMALLADPKLWALVRKLLAHDELRRDALRLAEKYADPGEDER